MRSKKDNTSGPCGRKTTKKGKEVKPGKDQTEELQRGKTGEREKDLQGGRGRRRFWRGRQKKPKRNTCEKYTGGNTFNLLGVVYNDLKNRKMQYESSGFKSKTKVRETRPKEGGWGGCSKNDSGKGQREETPGTIKRGTKGPRRKGGGKQRISGSGRGRGGIAGQWGLVRKKRAKIE